jgi:glycosyltransferase involved in cell wall biosynthesis
VHPTAIADKAAVHVVIPGPVATPTGGFVYDRHMVRALAATSRLASVIALPDRFPHADAATIAQAGALIASLPSAAWVLVDGLALTPLAPVLQQAGDGRLRIIALIHHPLCDEDAGGGPAHRRLFDAERSALRLARHVIVTSETTARRLADFGLPAGRVSVVQPGTERRAGWGRRRARRSPTLHLLSVGSLTPRKGQDVLLRALARLRRACWRLTLVGMTRDRSYARRLRMLARSLGIADRIRWLGVVPAAGLAGLYDAADLFVLASHHEGYGMAAAEAVGRGLPVVASSAGALADTVPAAARILVPPGDAKALATALGRLMTTPQTRLRLAFGARTSAARLPSWPAAETAFAAAIARITGRQ